MFKFGVNSKSLKMPIRRFAKKMDDMFPTWALNYRYIILLLKNLTLAYIWLNELRIEVFAKFFLNIKNLLNWPGSQRLNDFAMHWTNYDMNICIWNRHRALHQRRVQQWEEGVVQLRRPLCVDHVRGLRAREPNAHRLYILLCQQVGLTL